MNQSPNILVAGIGNIFLGDDAFGVEVAQELLRQGPMNGVGVMDFGIRGMDLTYALLEPYDAVILVDAVPRGETPGTLYVIEPNPDDVAAAADEPPQPGEVLIDAHSMDPVKVFRLARSMGSTLQRILLVGCEPTPFDPETEMDISMSPPVRSAVPEAIGMIRSLVDKLQREFASTGSTASNKLKGADDHGRSIATV